MTALLRNAAAAWAILGGVVLLAVVAVTTWNAGAFALDRLARTWGGSVGGLPGYEDFVRYAMAAAVPAFLPWCQWRRGHLAVDLFLRRAPRWLDRGIDAVGLIGIAAAALFLAWWMWLGMVETREDGALSRVLGWPEWPFYLPGIASLILWAMVALAQLAGRGEPKDDPSGAGAHG